jgi:hypothetical protein
VNKLKAILSRLNNRRKRNAHAVRNNALIAQEAVAVGAVPWSEVQKFFELFTPYKTQHELVRIGPNLDGGYLVPNDLDGLCAVFSPGVSDTLGFDLEMSNRVNACYLADASIEPPKGMPSNMTFVRKFLGMENKDNTITLDRWVSAHTQPGDDLLLQIDIEGAEYDVLNTVSDEILNQFRIILVEFHHLDQVFDRAQFDKMSTTVRKLTDTHVLCHLHANNFSPLYQFKGRDIPPLVEATYLRKDRVSGALTPAQVPQLLDQRNVTRFDDTPTPAFWKS